MAALMRSFSSCLVATRMWRNTERASLEKKPSMRFSQEPCVGVKVNVKRPTGCSASQAFVSLEMWAAVAILDESVNLPSEQINGLLRFSQDLSKFQVCDC